jgi:hypothetical protein
MLELNFSHFCLEKITENSSGSSDTIHFSTQVQNVTENGQEDYIKNRPRISRSRSFWDRVV